MNDMQELVRLIAIPPLDMPETDLLEACLAAARGGASAVQLRVKDVPAGTLLGLAERLVGHLPIPLFVNDRADIARLAGAVGAHIGADDLSTETIRKVLPKPFRVGVSVGNPLEAENALRADADYWSIGPFRVTTTKADAGAALGVSGFRKLVELCPASMPVVAIGGIDRDNVSDVLRAGAHGIAVVNAIFGHDDIEVATRELRDVLDNL